jgi:hypothetical protein
LNQEGRQEHNLDLIEGPLYYFNNEKLKQNTEDKINTEDLFERDHK